MNENRKLIIIIFINICATVISFAFLIHGHFETNYGLEYLGLMSSVMFLLLCKQSRELDDIFDKVKIMSIVFIIINGIAGVIQIVNSIIKYPCFFWWQNF